VGRDCGGVLLSRERSVGNHVFRAPPPLVDDLGSGTVYSCSSAAARCSRLTVGCSHFDDSTENRLMHEDVHACTRVF
jgi:hypothetical protein